jgi:hypothetical protein
VNQDSGVAERDSACSSDSWVCSGSPLGKEGAPKKFLANSSRTRTRNPNINSTAKHRINASNTSKRIAIPRNQSCPGAATTRGNRFNRLLRRVGAIHSNHRTCVQAHQNRNDAAARQRQDFGIETAADALDSSRDAARARFYEI